MRLRGLRLIGAAVAVAAFMIILAPAQATAASADDYSCQRVAHFGWTFYWNASGALPNTTGDGWCTLDGVTYEQVTLEFTAVRYTAGSPCVPSSATISADLRFVPYDGSPGPSDVTHGTFTVDLVDSAPAGANQATGHLILASGQVAYFGEMYGTGAICPATSGAYSFYPYGDPAPLSPNPEASISRNYLLEPPPHPMESGMPDPEDTATGQPEVAEANVEPAREALVGAGIDVADVLFPNVYTAVIPAAAAATYSDCPRSYLCLWQHASFRGRAFFSAVYQTGYYTTIQLRDFGLSDQVSSWRNRRSLIAVGFEHIDQGGRQICMRRFSYNPRMFYLNDQLSSAYHSRATFCT